MKPSDISNKIYTAIESRPNKILEILAFILYVIGIATLACFHEPWFDEFQALQISKSSVHDILFLIPHFEGHPPLWHLILKFTSLFTNNPEACIKIPNILFASMATWLLIFKSPFCRLVRISLPFTFFIFYQYGVVSRPYSLLMFALFLTAYFYHERNKRPFAFGLSLGLLCLSSCYGIMIAFAITLVWLIEIWNRQKILPFIKSFITDKRFYSMMFLVLLCLLIFFEIYPVQNEVALGHIWTYPINQQILYCLFGAISDATLSNIINISNITSHSIMDNSSIIPLCCGVYLTSLLVRYFYDNRSMLFFFTYACWLLFIGFGYYYHHHIGILTLILIFNFWCIDYKSNKVTDTSLKKQLTIAICIILLIQIYWSAKSAFLEKIYDYSYGKAIATYIKNNNIEYKYKIFCPWHVSHKLIGEDDKEITTYKHFTKDTKIKKLITKNVYDNQPFAVEINAYFEKNIFYNFNMFDPQRAYTLHADFEGTSSQKIFDTLTAKGIPDIMIFNDANIIIVAIKSEFPQLRPVKKSWDEAYPDVDFMHEYVPIKSLPYGHVWKGNRYEYVNHIYVRKSLYETAKTWE